MRSYLERVILGVEHGALSWAIRGLVWPLSLLYSAGLGVYLGVYKTGLRKRHRVSVPVISVGNLTFGGTGKTPAVQTICRMLMAQGRRVVVLSRGHGGKTQGSAIVSDGESVTGLSTEVGDEPVMLAQSLPGVPVVVGKDRRKSGDLAIERFKPDVIVLDDGMQYWQLHRDIEIVVMDATKPFGSGFVMPMGDLREPICGIRRADVLLINGVNSLAVSKRDAVISRLHRLAPEALALICSKRASAVRCVSDGRCMGPEWLIGRKIAAFCGIGKPESFVEMLEYLGACVVSELRFPDHHQYISNDIELIELERESYAAEAVLTTEKDAIRLAKDIPIKDLYVLSIELEIDGRERFGQYLADRLDQKSEATPAKKAAN